MLNLAVVYIFLLGIFGVVGFLRGWQREVIAAAGLVGSIAALSQFGYLLVNLFTDIPVPGTLPQDIPQDLTNPFRIMFWTQFLFHTAIAFFSYQMVSRLADLATRGRFGDRLRAGLESKIIGVMFGLLNGYLYVGALWGFLEFAMNPGSTGYYRLPDAAQYAFGSDVITRPVFDSFSWVLAGYMPPLFSSTFWIVAFFIFFFIVIVALL